MRPVRFVTVSEDGQALVLADEVGRLLALPRDDRLLSAVREDGSSDGGVAQLGPGGSPPALSPRDIQARIRAGESADDVARIAGVPVDRVLRYAGPVLQERAMLAQHARRAKLRSSEAGASLAEVADARLAQHGVDADKISWDAYRRDDGTWRIVASWPSGKATAQAVWELDRARTLVSPHDDMAHYLCTERPAPILGQDESAPEAQRRPARGRLRAEPTRGGHGLPEPARSTGHGLPEPAEEQPPSRRSGRDPIRAGRDALLATLDRPLGAAGRGLDTPAAAAAMADQTQSQTRSRPGSTRAASPFDDDADAPKEVPAVPSLAVLRPRRTGAEAGTGAGAGAGAGAEKSSRKRGPSWDEVLFGSPPAAREG